MTDRIDELLNQLRVQPADHDLSRLESAVNFRIERRNKTDIFGGRTLQVQLAVSCVALILGVFVAQLAGVDIMPMPLNSETVVLSDDSAIAPSVLLEGGI